ncbi:testis-expressed protein 44 [Rhynchocyon petersi]
MTTEPSEEAGSISSPQHGAPEIILGNVGNSQATDSPAGESQSQVGDSEIPADQQDVTQLANKVAILPLTATPEDSKEPPEVTALPLHQAPRPLQVSTSLHNTPTIRLVEDVKRRHSELIVQQQLLNEGETSLSQGVLSDGLSPTAEVQLTVDDAQAVGNIEATQETLWAPEDNLVASSDQGLSLSLPPSPSPSSHVEWRPLDCSLYMDTDENSYMPSMTSLLGGGEGSISSLADILVWSEATVDMATSILATGHCSVTELLQGTRPSLRSASSILDVARAALSSRLTASTDSALRSAVHMLETFEQRTVEGIHSVVRFLTGHLTPSQIPASPSCN